ncbi:hypothetical protein [Paenibacillus periandrae]|uniref:hypothetical protein n=1 Tax=Paenibacillus periandrae TaxID=1761741 RepID=UPI001F098B34|nr:hypothetical protein [Paenibacillus periandrae]
MHFSVAFKALNRISIGKSYSDLASLSKSFEEAQSVSGYWSHRAPNAIIFFNEATTEEITPFPHDLLQELQHAINHLDKDAIHSNIDELIGHWERKSPSLSTHTVKAQMVSLLLSSLQTLTSDEKQKEEWISQEIVHFSESNAYRSIEECKSWLSTMIEKIIDVKLRTLSSLRKYVIEEVKAYIHQNFQSKITLASLSEHREHA